MIGKGVRYGYVCIGEAFIFLHIPEDDPTVVYFSLCIPHLDVVANDEAGLRRTAVAQVFAIILQAMSVEPPPMSWHDKTTSLGTWPADDNYMLENYPKTEHNEERSTECETQRGNGLQRPYQSPGECKPLQSDFASNANDSSEEGLSSPTAEQSSHSDKKQASQTHSMNTTTYVNKIPQGSARPKQRAIDTQRFCTQNAY